MTNLISNRELLREITRATVVPILVREIGEGRHDHQLAEIFTDNADRRVIRAVVERIVDIGKVP